MGRLSLLVGAVCTLLGCSFQRDVPADVVITCTDGVCPRGMRCNARINRCLAEAAFDDTPPDLEPGTVSVLLLAPPASPLNDVSSLGPGGQATLGFSVTEPLAQLPRVVPLDELACTVTQRSQLGFSVTCALTTGVTGRRALLPSVELVDVVGNSAVVAVSTLDVDADTPQAPDVDAPMLVTLVREPWGTAASRGSARRLIRGLASAAEPMTRLVATDPGGGVVLARADVDATGSWGDLVLPQSAAEDVFVRLVDGAGNTSPVRRVRNRSVAASLFGVVPRSPQSTPHGFTTYDVHGPSVVRTDGVARGEADLLATPDASVLVRGGFAWARQWLDVPVGYDQRPGFVSDEHGARLVRFGGRNGLVARQFSRLSELRSMSWHELEEEDLESDGSPADRGMTAMAWDTFRDEAVLFGGIVALPGSPRSSISDDTWTLSGRSWRRQDTLGPPARFGHSMAWDRARRQAVLVGGLSPDGGLYEDTWAWNGTRWSQLDAGSPGKVFDGALAWNSSLNGVVLAAGRDVNARGSTWLFDGARWTQLDAGPGPAGSAAGAYDVRRDTMVVITNSLQTWEFQGGRWSRVVDVPGPNERSTALAWDATRGVVVAAGAGSLNECDPMGACRDVLVPTVTWDGVQWRAQGQRTSFSVAPLPFATSGALGGLLAVPGEGVSWLWRDEQWLKRFDVNSPDAGGLVCSTADGGVVSVTANGTFAHDGTGWVRIGAVPPNVATSTALVEVGGALWLNAGPLAVTLGADGGWSASGLGAFNANATSLPAGQALLAGSTMPLAQGQYFVLSPAPDGGLLRGPIGAPAKLLSALTWDPLRQQVVSFSGFPTVLLSPSPELTVGRLDAGFEVVSVNDPLGTGTPKGRAGASFAFDPSSQQLVLSAGYDLVGNVNDSWQLSSFGTRPSAVMRVDVNALGLPLDAVVTELRLVGRAGGTGFDGGAPVDGVHLQLFREGAWWNVPGASWNASAASPIEWSTTLVDPTVLSALFAAQASVWVALVPQGATGVEAAQLRAHALEVTVAYRVP